MMGGSRGHSRHRRRSGQAVSFLTFLCRSARWPHSSTSWEKHPEIFLETTLRSGWWQV
jgi:hypothetical protein